MIHISISVVNVLHAAFFQSVNKCPISCTLALSNFNLREGSCGMRSAVKQLSQLHILRDIYSRKTLAIHDWNIKVPMLIIWFWKKVTSASKSLNEQTVMNFSKLKEIVKCF